MLTFEQIEELFFDVTCACLEINSTAESSQKAVRRSWSTQGQPHWKVNDNITVFKITPEDDNYNKIREYRYFHKLPVLEDNYTQEVTYTNVFTVMWSVYGPNSRDSSMKIFTNIFDPDVREKLRKKKIYLIPEVPAPVRNPELFEGQWWERIDIRARFNELITMQKNFGFFKSATVIVNDEKRERTIQIEPSD